MRCFGFAGVEAITPSVGQLPAKDLPKQPLEGLAEFVVPRGVDDGVAGGVAEVEHLGDKHEAHVTSDHVLFLSSGVHQHHCQEERKPRDGETANDDRYHRRCSEILQ